LKGDAAHWLTDPEYAALRHPLEAAHAAVEAALVEARRRVPLSVGRRQYVDYPGDPANGPQRIRLLGRWVNKGKKEGRSVVDLPGPLILAYSLRG